MRRRSNESWVGGYNYYNNQPLSAILVLKDGAQYWSKIGELKQRRFGLAGMNQGSKPEQPFATLILIIAIENVQKSPF